MTINGMQGYIPKVGEQLVVLCSDGKEHRLQVDVYNPEFPLQGRWGTTKLHSPRCFLHDVEDGSLWGWGNGSKGFPLTPDQWEMQAVNGLNMRGQKGVRVLNAAGKGNKGRPVSPPEDLSGETLTAWWLLRIADVERELRDARECLEKARMAEVDDLR